MLRFNEIQQYIFTFFKNVSIHQLLILLKRKTYFYFRNFKYESYWRSAFR